MKLSKMNLKKWFLTLAILVSSIAGFSQTTVDLSLHQPGTSPLGSTFEWHNNSPVSVSTLMDNAAIGSAPVGTYFGVFNANNSCYSPVAKMSVAVNACPAVTVDISSYSSTPNVEWHTSSTPSPASKVANVNQVAVAGAYFAFINNAGNYSIEQGMVVVAISNCADTTPPVAPTIDVVTANPNGTISVSGTAEIGSTVTVTFPDGTTGTFVADASGNYGPVTSATPQTSGQIKATAKDAAGNISLPATAIYTDATAPLAPTITLPITVNTNGTIAVSGKAEPKSTVTVTFPDGTTGTFVADASGNYGPVTSATPQTSGQITATAKDAAGNISLPATAIYTDATAPLAPTITLPITVNTNGTIAVSGKAEPKSTVTVTFPDGTTGTFVADASGNYGPVTSVNPQTSGQITATAKDAAGNISLPATAIYTDATAPLAPTITLPITVNTNGTIAVSGKAEPKSTVRVTFPDGTTGTFVADASGNYGPVTSGTPQTSGQIKATAKDAAGNISLPATAIYTDATAPLAPTITLPITVNTNGTIAVSGKAEPKSTVTITFPDGTTGTFVADASGNYGPVTSVNPQTSGVIAAIATDTAGNVSPQTTNNFSTAGDNTAPLAPTITLPITVNPNGTISVSGTAEIGSTVTVTFPDGTTGTFVADASGNYGPVISATPQTSGQITATAKDAAGNISLPATAIYTDATAPLAPTITLPITVNTNGTIAVSGKAEPKSTVTVTFPDGTTGTFVADASGNYGPVTSATPQTSGQITATAKDAAGNISLPATAIYTDATAPLAPTITLPITVNTNGTIAVSGKAEPKSTVTVTFPDGTTGTFVADASGNYGPVTSVNPQTSGQITATAKDAAGNISLPATAIYTDATAPLAPTITLPITVNTNGTIAVSGKAEPKSTVTVTFPDGTTGTFVADASGNYGPVTSVTPQTSGQIKATAKDAAGNISLPATAIYTDATAPLAPTITLPIIVNTNGTIAVSGKAEPKSTVTITFPDGTTGTFVADALGNYGPVTSVNPQTSGVIAAIATDTAGNVSPQTTNNFSTAGDNTAPLAPTITLPITVNANGTISIRGTAEPKSTVTITFPDGTTGTSIADALGNYGPVTSATPQTSGQITAIAKDAAGNVSPKVTINYIDVTAPLAPTIDTLTLYADGTVAISGKAEIGSTVTITFPDGTTLNTVADTGGHYGPVKSISLQPNGIISAQSTDEAGNRSTLTKKIFTNGSNPSTPSLVLVEEPNGIIAVTGIADPNNIVTVMFPDGSTKTVVANANGNYGPVKSDFPQPSGNVKAIAEDVVGTTSPEKSVVYVDTTAPSAPKYNLPLKVNSNGIVEVSGTAEPRSTVVVTFADGTNGKAVVDDAGNFGPVRSINPQVSGTVIAVAVDLSGNVSLDTKYNLSIGAIAIVKTGILNDANNDGLQQVGETITYHFEVYNTGNVALTDVTVKDDDLQGIVLSGGPITLNVGENNVTEFKAIYTLQEADIVAGSVTNQAIAYGKTPAGVYVTDLSDSTSILRDSPTVIEITTDRCTINIFNGLTPGDDGKNDVFYINGVECFPKNSIQIYNRWGVIVFQKEEYNNSDRAFRGVSNGQFTVSKAEPLPSGTYYYVFKYLDDALVGREKAGYLYINK